VENDIVLSVEASTTIALANADTKKLKIQEVRQQTCKSPHGRNIAIHFNSP
jgi:hypothetical protein